MKGFTTLFLENLVKILPVYLFFLVMIKLPLECLLNLMIIKGHIIVR